MTESLGQLAGPDELRLLHREYPDRYPFLLQSTSNGGVLGRFDILFAQPGASLWLDSEHRLHGDGLADPSMSFLDGLDAWWSRERLANPCRLPFHGGWFLFLGYELAGSIEPGLALHPDPLLPAAFAVRCSAALILEHDSGEVHYVEENLGTGELRQVREDLSSLRGLSASAGIEIRSVSEQEPAHFIDAVVRAKEHIAAGDVYQANLSREWVASLDSGTDAAAIYASLCRANPGPFAGAARWNGIEILSSSPERLLRVRNGIAATRPIAGTRPRSEDDQTDNSLSTELFSHPKERAEHVMLIDLERNDLGRVCEPGSVEVDEMMVLESYAHVHHIVSNVSGRLRADVTPGQAISAVFPGGTITGCPKIRCMEIISELEEGPRGAYTGSFGYLNRDGSLDLNILIRTMVKQRDTLTFRAGSGIVADSDPGAELEETRAKAEGMLRALRK